MLVACPDCAREVSDRAPACPGCGFPIAEHHAQLRADAEVVQERASRELVGEADCVPCNARGFDTTTFVDEDGNTREGFAWCQVCEHTGRVALCRSSAGYWAVRRSVVEAFVAGTVDAHDTDVVLVGLEPPPHRYPGT